MNKIFLIDAYAMIYRSYYALLYSANQTFYSTQMKMNTGTIHGFMNSLTEIITKEKPTHIAVAFDHGKTFRHDFYPPYKAQRDETPEDIKLSVPVIKELLTAMNIPILQVDGFEADDIIGAVATELAKDLKTDGNTEDSARNIYMVTPDKDYSQLVQNNVFMYKPGFKGGYDVLGPKEICDKYGISCAKQMVDYLALMGDSADNFPGCPGVGPKTATKLINDWGTCENIITHAAEIKGALGKKVAEHIEDIKISRFLAEIVTDYSRMCGEGMLPDVNTLLNDMSVKEWDYPTLSSLLSRLELRTIKRKMIPEDMAVADTSTQEDLEVEEKKLIGYDLFGEPIYQTVKVKKSKQNKTNTSVVNNSKENDESIKIINKELPPVGQEVENNGKNFSVSLDDYSIELVDNEGQAQKVCDFILTKQTLGFHLLTNTYGRVKLESAFESTIAAIMLVGDDKKIYYFGFSEDKYKNSRLLEILRPVLESENIEKVGHDLKYKMVVLHNYGIELKGQLRDVMIAHYLLYCGISARHGISEIKTDLTGTPSIDFAELKKNWKKDEDERLKSAKQKTKNLADIRYIDLPFEAVSDYAKEQISIISESWIIYEAKLKVIKGQWHLFNDIEMPLMEVLYDMEITGVALNLEALNEVRKTFNERLLKHEQKIYELAGKEFTLTNPKQLGDVLFEDLKLVKNPKKTKTGYATGEEILTPLRSKHPIIGEILDYRGLKKLINTYVDALPALINEKTGRIHTTFNQCKTTTGRLSSSDPNLQNIPMRGDDGKEIRKCFIASQKAPQPPKGELLKNALSTNEALNSKTIYQTPPSGAGGLCPSGAVGLDGALFFSADYSQIELRVMAHMSGDAEMQHAFCEGIDIHRATAANVYHKSLDEISGDERSKAKRANFGLIYGITPFGLAQNMGIERSEAKQLMDGFFVTFPDIQGFMDHLKEVVREREVRNDNNEIIEKGYSTTLLHRRRYLDKINAGNGTERSIAEREAMNSPIQGSAADIIKIAMVNIHRRFKANNLKSKMILQVHDELNFSVVPEEKDIVERIVLEEMQGAYQLDVPLIADYGWADNWLDAHLADNSKPLTQNTYSREMLDKKDNTAKEPNFIALDFETAQGKNPCQIGLCIVENGQIKETVSHLIRPVDNEYTPQTIAVHHITPDMTANEPSFPEVWEKVKHYFDGAFIVAHNAMFDMHVLSYVLTYYNIPYPTIKGYACTCDLNHRQSLDKACNQHGFDCEHHHDACDDAINCAKLYIDYVNDKEYTYEKKKKVFSTSRATVIKEEVKDADPNNPFFGKNVVVTGEFELGRENVERQVHNMGAILKGGISKKVDYVIAGTGAGPSKIQKIKELKEKGVEIKVLNEEEYKALLANN